MSLLDDLDAGYERQRELLEAAAGRRARRFRGQPSFRARRSSFCPGCGLYLHSPMRIICADLWNPETGKRLDKVGWCLDCARDLGWGG